MPKCVCIYSSCIETSTFIAVESDSPQFLLTEEEKVDRGFRKAPRGHERRGSSSSSTTSSASPTSNISGKGMEGGAGEDGDEGGGNKGSGKGSSTASSSANEMPSSSSRASSSSSTVTDSKAASTEATEELPLTEEQKREEEEEKIREGRTLSRLNHGGDHSARMSWFRLRWWKIREQLSGTSGKSVPDVIITGRVIF